MSALSLIFRKGLGTFAAMSLLPRLLLFTLCALSSVAAQELTLQSVAADKKIWPHRVTTTAAVEIPAGAKSAARTLPSGSTFSVKEIKPEGIVIDLDDTAILVPAASTDLLTRAGTIASQVRALSASSAPVDSPGTQSLKAAIKASSLTPSSMDNQVAKSLTGDLVSLEGGKLTEFNAAELGSKKYLLVYYSAHWCPPCRAFTPELVKWYNSVSSQHAKFDIIFYSNDRSEGDMLTYMTDTRMPWPPLGYRKTRLGHAPAKYAGPGIPDLVLLDDKGNVLSDSYQGSTYVGPGKVANDLARLLQNP